MRAAISHKFGREFKMGAQVWAENVLEPGTFFGNPSLSPVVSQYMVSLRRRKVRAGEAVTSARSMDEQTMRKLWEYNTAFKKDAEVQASSRKRKHDQPEYWGGYKVRQMLQTLYVVSMLCLLRYDEALRIMWTDIEFTTVDGAAVVKLELPFRKTDQNGGIAPFWLWPDLERPWMDATLALAEWWLICKSMGIERYGYVFRSRHGFDESSSSFLEYFRNNMIDIGIDPRPYGTYSFRRGGCQYLAMVRRWPIRTICEWGGWAENFDSAATIFKYLMSWVDSPSVDRKDLFNPNRPGSDPCSVCGRTCMCW
ncbi:hypothetical protein C2E23DRAFT_864500 [Lenzites betulinus]|nr:hypothetical protein C2E23DRAFT_864500 [Lenzites betulinus]